MAITPEQQAAIDRAGVKYLGGAFGSGVTSNIVNAAEGRDLDAERKKILDQILANAEGQRGENTDYVDQNVTPELERLKASAATAALQGEGALNMQDTARDKVQGVYNKAAQDSAESTGRYNASDQAALQEYLGATNPLMTQLEAGGWGGDVANDAEGLGAQRDVMSRYKELSGPQVTAQEKLIGEMARRKFEGQDRGNREAVQANLAQRGLNSGTLQIANNLAAQQRLGQDRTLSELGMQANAVGRSMQALEGYGGQAGQIRTANDAMSKFNKEGSQIAQRFQDQTAQNEARRVGDLAGTRNTTTRETNQTGFGREATARGDATKAGSVGYDTDTAYNNAYSQQGQQEFNNQQGVVGAATGVAGARAGASNPGAVQDALRLALGENAVDKAEVENDRVV